MKGTRVGAILGSDDNGIEFIGYGVYDGEHIPTEAVGYIAEALRDNGVKNPRILLDSGSYVYGCECWWGPQNKVEKMLEGKKVIHVEIKDIREKYKKETA